MMSAICRKKHIIRIIICAIWRRAVQRMSLSRTLAIQAITEIPWRLRLKVRVVAVLKRLSTKHPGAPNDTNNTTPEMISGEFWHWTLRSCPGSVAAPRATHQQQASGDIGDPKKNVCGGCQWWVPTMATFNGGSDAEIWETHWIWGIPQAARAAQSSPRLAQHFGAEHPSGSSMVIPNPEGTNKKKSSPRM